MVIVLVAEPDVAAKKLAGHGPLPIPISSICSGIHFSLFQLVISRYVFLLPSCTARHNHNPGKLEGRGTVPKHSLLFFT